MDVAADDTIEAAAFCLVRHRLFIPVDRLHRALHLLLQPGGERPVGITQPAPHQIEPVVHRKRKAVGPVTQQCQRAGVAHHTVELIAMDHQQALAVRRHVGGFVHQAYAAHLQVHRQPGTEHLVMIAGDVDHVRAIGRMLQDQPQHVIMRRIPVPGFAQPPAIHDVPHQEQPVAGDAGEEIHQEIAAAAARAEMEIRDENGLVTMLAKRKVHDRRAE